MTPVSPGMQLCIDSEGYKKDRGDGWVVAYWDAIGHIWTIAFGSTGPDIKKGTTWTRDHAVLRLQQGWNSAKAGALRASPILSNYPLMLEAVTDFCYNCGVGAYQTSTLRRKVNASDWRAALSEFPKWKYSKGRIVAGLVTRRAKEQALFASQLSPAHAPVATPAAVPDQSAPIDVAPSDPLPTANTDSTPPQESGDPIGDFLRNIGTRLGGLLRALADNLPQNKPTSRDNDHH